MQQNALIFNILQETHTEQRKMTEKRSRPKGQGLTFVNAALNTFGM